MASQFMRAVEWMGLELLEEPGADRLALVDRASFKFNLSLKEGEVLLQWFTKKQ